MVVHGMAGTRTHASWSKMLGRCRNPTDPSYSRYGGRGISVCQAWFTFDGFLADMGERPTGTSLDRIDNARGYEPGNCRWATPAEQSQNKRNVKLSAVAVAMAR